MDFTETRLRQRTRSETRLYRPISRHFPGGFSRRSPWKKSPNRAKSDGNLSAAEGPPNKGFPLTSRPDPEVFHVFHRVFHILHSPVENWICAENPNPPFFAP